MPTCYPVHLGQASGAAGSPCAGHSDCDQGSFCGASYCREVDQEFVTVCLEEAILEGAPPVQDGTPPDLLTLLTVSNYYLEPPLEYKIQGPAVRDRCHPVWNRCVLVPAAVVHQGGAFADVGSELAGGGLEFVSNQGWAVVKSEDIDQGCIRMNEDSYESPPNNSQVTLWMSVWYP